MKEEYKMAEDIVEKELKSLRHYVDNEKFLKSMNEWKKDVKKAEKKGQKRPPVTDYIAECFIMIAEHLSQRPNFINYPFREDMVGDGIENCIAYAHNFDSEKSSNPFSYFTQIIYYAFLRRIEREKKQSFIKYKCLQMNDVDGKFVDWLQNNQGSSTFSEFLQHTFFLSENDIEKMEAKEKVKKKRGKKSKKKS
jgi:DNA-directed RNA polymerase specialized sigma24 family protein